MRKYTIITIIIIGVILGFLTGIYLYKINQINTNKPAQEIAKEIEDECTQIAQLNDNGLLDLVKTNSQEEKISPNCTLILKIYYSKCEHMLEKREDIKETEINMTEEELKTKFSEWEIQKFTPTEIVLYKEVDDFCKEHYLLKEKEGYIAIYELDENNKEKFLEITDISTQYLAIEDLQKIQKGITIYTKKELNKTIEDFE
ncbi:MAG: hypothetical protein Q4G09_03305 [Clostridia bacterium]|nr:hypothetical protein [Clostridia bacterium]